MSFRVLGFFWHFVCYLIRLVCRQRIPESFCTPVASPGKAVSSAFSAYDMSTDSTGFLSAHTCPFPDTIRVITKQSQRQIRVFMMEVTGYKNNHKNYNAEKP